MLLINYFYYSKIPISIFSVTTLNREWGELHRQALAETMDNNDENHPPSTPATTPPATPDDSNENDDDEQIDVEETEPPMSQKEARDKRAEKRKFPHSQTFCTDYKI